MMNKVMIFCFMLLFLNSCTYNESPVFVKMNNFKIIHVSSGKITIGVDVYFENPNDVGGQIETNGVIVSINDVEFAEVNSEVFEVPAGSDFIMPLIVYIPMEELKNKLDEGFLKGLIGGLFNQDLKVHFKGELRYKLFGYSNTYDIDQSGNLKIKL